MSQVLSHPECSNTFLSVGEHYCRCVKPSDDCSLWEFWKEGDYDEVKTYEIVDRRKEKLSTTVIFSY